ncbi:hypothetical protein EVAR_47468_1 [Eumeta japonica]|uniref:Uncharacterized protein n=1 Tax=Eumeta variegata TaxID=151549 RepID=A0A4C1XCB6_EUMVA|nr:hypothetical protein EVAR_47468_1 [Eumeta japonica]
MNWIFQKLRKNTCPSAFTEVVNGPVANFADGPRPGAFHVAYKPPAYNKIVLYLRREAGGGGRRRRRAAGGGAARRDLARRSMAQAAAIKNWEVDFTHAPLSAGLTNRSYVCEPA